MFEDYELMIEQIIEEHEGGWVLTDRKDDSGGLTYGGMTYATFDKWQRKHANTMFVRSAFKRAAKINSQVLKDAIRQAYYDTFVKRSKVRYIPSFLRKPFISTAINVGNKHAVRIMQRATNRYVLYYNSIHTPLKVDGVFGPKTEAAIAVVQDHIETNQYWQRRLNYIIAFSDACMQYYIRVVQNNARHWRSSYKRGTKPPSVLQSENLMGWFNRTKMYRR